MKSNKILFPILLSIALLAGICIGIFFDFPNQSLAMNESSQRENKIRQIINYIDYDYVDELNTDSLLDITINDLLRKLDPHSVYIPQQEVEASEESIRGSFEGIGIEFKIYRDTLTVIRALSGGPSARAGIQSGDRILLAGNREMYGEDLTADDVINTLKGKSGSRVTMSVYHPVSGTTEVKSIKRGEIPLQSVTTSFMVNDHTGYMKLSRFSQNSDVELARAIKKLKKQGAHNLILDLRDNPGGLLSVARDVSDEFLTDNKLIVFTKDRNGDKNSIYATSSGNFEKGHLAVLINEGSASASEIVAGAIQDNDRGWIIGRRSFGKGLVQEEMTLSDGSKIRLTTRRYYTPSGRSIQKPYKDYDRGFLEQSGFDGTHKVGADTTHSIYKTLGGRNVYGGGGISPDFEVPIDTSRSAVILYHLSGLANLDEQAFSYVDSHRKDFAAISEAEFFKNFVVDDSVLTYFFGHNAERIEAQSEETVSLIKGRIKAYIAYNLYGSEAFQKAYFPNDPMVSKALEVLSNPANFRQ